MHCLEAWIAYGTSVVALSGSIWTLRLLVAERAEKKSLELRVEVLEAELVRHRQPRAKREGE